MDFKEYLKLNKKPYPYKEIADRLNGLNESQLDEIDKIIAEGEQQSLSMVGIRKLYRMISNSIVKDRMKSIYSL